MSKLRTTTIEPEGATTNLDLGATGDSVVVNSDAIKANTFKDAGGNVLWTSNGSGVLSSLNSGLAGGGMTLLDTTVVTSSTSSVDFDATTFTSTYDEYWVIGYGVRPATNGTHFKHQCGSSFNTSWSGAVSGIWHVEGGTGTMGDNATASQWQQTSLATIFDDMGADETERAGNFILKICQPTSTAVYKMALLDSTYSQDGTQGATSTWGAYQWRTFSAITDWRFKYDGGDIASGTFKVYGLE
tara:strand:- start:342 stop:1070 length:729 start_codon:yes stop_codon:yes gene_type:complete